MDKYVVLDIETTGLSKYYHKITEIAAVKYENGNEEEFQTLINPEVRIPEFITRLTGIDNEMVKEAPTIKEVLPKFLEFLGDSTIVAHNATFDYGFISYNLESHFDIKLENNKVCTRRLANRLLPDLPKKKLGDLCNLFEITNEQAHRAMADTKATLLVFQKFLSMMKLADVKTEKDILKFQSLPRSKIIN